MAEFCWDCTRDLMGVEPERNDFMGIVEPPDLCYVLCEGCGPITVDHKGVRVPRSEPIEEHPDAL